MVVNAPTSNITSAAELAVGLLLASARNIAPANQALKGGAWKRNKYGGVELLDKKVGVVGFGRIGQLVAERLKGFGMEILAYDPDVLAQRAGQLGAQLVTLDELLEQSDFITVHLPKHAETLGLIGKEALTKVKPTVRIINAARGGIVDEEALAEALRDGRAAGAGIDVFATEPTTESPLFEHESVVVTPHLGASTDEAQEKAGVAVARSVRLALGGDLVPDAVNVSGGAVPEEVRPGIALVEKLGRVFTAFAGSVPVQLDVDVRGEITPHDVSIWELAALKGLFTDVTEDPVTYVNAPLLAKERGCESRLLTDAVAEDFRNVTTLHGTLADGTTVSIAGTLTGPKLVQKLIGVNGYDLEIPLSTTSPSSPTSTAPASSARSAASSATPTSTSPGCRCRATTRTARPSSPSPWTARSRRRRLGHRDRGGRRTCASSTSTTAGPSAHPGRGMMGTWLISTPTTSPTGTPTWGRPGQPCAVGPAPGAAHPTTCRRAATGRASTRWGRCRLGPRDVLLDLACGRGGYGVELAREAAPASSGSTSRPPPSNRQSERVRIGLAHRAALRVGDMTATGLPRVGHRRAVRRRRPVPRRVPAACREAYRVLAPGGRAAFTGWEAHDPDDPGIPDRIRRVDLGAGLRGAGFADVSAADRDDWAAAELAAWRAVVALPPSDDPAVRALQEEGQRVVDRGDVVRRVLATGRR